MSIIWSLVVYRLVHASGMSRSSGFDSQPENSVKAECFSLTFFLIPESSIPIIIYYLFKSQHFYHLYEEKYHWTILEPDSIDITTSYIRVGTVILRILERNKLK